MALPTKVSEETAKLIRNEIVNTAKFSFVIAYEFKYKFPNSRNYTRELSLNLG